MRSKFTGTVGKMLGTKSFGTRNPGAGRLTRSGLATAGMAAMALLAGCESSRDLLLPVATTQMSTDIDPAQGEPAFWLSQPAQSSVSYPDFDTLWNTADSVSRDLLFPIDRQDRRSGLLVTQPTVSAQWFEPWRRELQTGKDLADSSVATIRRTIYYSFAKTPDGYTVTPKVLVERQGIAERRVSGQLTRTYFRRDRDLAAYGTAETDAGVLLPDNYWYPIARDEALEAELARRMKRELKQ